MSQRREELQVEPDGPVPPDSSEGSEPEALARLIVDVWLRYGDPEPGLSASDIEIVLEFIRMLQAPGAQDENVLNFIRNHLLDPELRAQRGKKT